MDGAHRVEFTSRSKIYFLKTKMAVDYSKNESETMTLYNFQAKFTIIA